MSNQLKIPVNTNDHHLNTLHAPVILLEYGDYECPYSAVATTLFSRLLKEYRTDLCFVYRHFPLKGIHPFSELAAVAAEAAGEQNKFWEYHELLFTNQEELSEEQIENLALKLELDMDLFQSDLGRYDLVEKVRSDHHGGIQNGVQSTPTIFINGFQYEGQTSYWPLREAIELELTGERSSASF
jgi:protein-disulfide isomerase